MVGVGLASDSTVLRIVGAGFRLEADFEIGPGIVLEPFAPALNVETVAKGCEGFFDYAAVIAGHDLATFSIAVTGDEGSRDLAVKGWNALWLFHLLSLATETPCHSLYSVSDGSNPVYHAAHREVFSISSAEAKAASLEQLGWAKTNQDSFDTLVGDAAFSTAMRCFGNSHVLRDLDLRIMLLWSGIEGLLSIDSELSRRLATYSCLMLQGSHAEKVEHFKYVKKAYGVRSKVVHGGRPNKETLEKGYTQASDILCHLLRRCVELGRVPSTAELDALSFSSTIS